MSKRPKIQWQWNLILWRRKLLPKRWKIFLYCFFLVLIKFREFFIIIYRLAIKFITCCN